MCDERVARGLENFRRKVVLLEASKSGHHHNHHCIELPHGSIELLRSSERERGERENMTTINDHK